MRSALPGGKGLDPSVYQVYNSGKYVLVSDDMTAGKSISSETDTPVLKSVADLTYSSIPNGTCSGTEYLPDFYIKDGPYTLTEGVDYTAIYEDCSRPGRAFITIDGIGKYDGTKILYYYTQIRNS